MKYYVLVLENCEIGLSGPFHSEKDRNDEAKRLWKDMRPENGAAVFKAEIDTDGYLCVSSYLEGELN